jgi:hypothetical protein
MFYFTRKTQEFHMGCMTTRHTVLSWYVNTNYSCNGTNNRHWDDVTLSQH